MALNSRRLFGIAVAWGVLWLACWAAVGAVIAFFDPDSLDPGEWTMFVVIFGPMGLLSGLVVGALLSLRRDASPFDATWIRAALAGILGTAIVQVAYLGHGDQGLAANLQMALGFSVIGGLVTLAWLKMARVYRRGEPREPSHPR